MIAPIVTPNRIAAFARLLSLVIAVFVTQTTIAPAFGQDRSAGGVPVASAPQASGPVSGTVGAAPSGFDSRVRSDRSHDWRSPGYISVVDGQLYDGECRPFKTTGSNLPNIMFRYGLHENLEWMRQHKMRWMRVIASGHGPPGFAPGVDNGEVEARLAWLLREVEAFNLRALPHESIHVLISLTDYYEPGVPGDKYGFDSPGWCWTRVLNAPWYRRGFPSYSFKQECGAGTLAEAPNYEVNFKPWVQRLVRVGADSPAVLGWQLGNEMKARNSETNGISEAYSWYLDWLKDMTDTIREVDQNHLIFAPAQYLAELVEWPYRPDTHAVKEELVPTYARLLTDAVNSCGKHCWNVWSITNYDFRMYAIDDALMLHRAGIAVVATEHGITHGQVEGDPWRDGGDRVAALELGVLQPWQDVEGNWHNRLWSVTETVNRLGLDGIAPWGSPNPDPSTDPWLDVDNTRGISFAHEGMGLWEAWRRVGSTFEQANLVAGPSQACVGLQSAPGLNALRGLPAPVPQPHFVRMEGPGRGTATHGWRQDLTDESFENPFR